MIDEHYVPFTPAGTECANLASNTKDEAWEALLEDAKHMPYKTKDNFYARGYRVIKTKVQ